MHRFDGPAGRDSGHQLSEDLPAEDLLAGRIGDRQNSALIAAAFDVEDGAKLLEIHCVPFAAFAVATSWNFLTFPDGVIGKASTTCHATGVFWRARPAACRNSASSPAEAFSWSPSTTNATGTSPNLASRPATTAACRTAGGAARRSSMSRAENFSPPRLMTSLIRPVMVTNPASSSTPMSPVR